MALVKGIYVNVDYVINAKRWGLAFLATMYNSTIE
jgi:hypothetical protein